MTYQEINKMIESFGLPYAYYQFPEGTKQATPFVVFYFVNSDDLYAENSNYQRIEVLNIELYTSEKDFDIEGVIEEFLSDNGLSYYKEENYINSEKMWQIAYEMEVMINGKQS